MGILWKAILDSSIQETVTGKPVTQFVTGKLGPEHKRMVHGTFVPSTVLEL